MFTGDRPRFRATFIIHELANVPLVSGRALVKWELQGAGRTDTHGKTSRAPIKDYKVIWKHTVETSVRIAVRNPKGAAVGQLAESTLKLEVFQEHGEHNRILLGHLLINLAEYVGRQQTRRFLLQGSKVNSTLRISLHLSQIEGSSAYTVPPLRSVGVFGGISGVFGDGKAHYAEESTPHDDSVARDMFHGFSGQVQSSELAAEAVVDDILRGGDGWSQVNLDANVQDQFGSPAEPAAEDMRDNLASWTLSTSASAAQSPH